MKIRYIFPLAVLITFSLVACSRDKPEKVKLGNGAYSVEVPPDASFRCQILHHASDCNNYNVPNSTEGMEVRVCEGESKKTAFLTVTGKHPTGPNAELDKDSHRAFASGWSHCQDAKITRSQEISLDDQKAMDYVLTTPLGEGATRVFVDNGYSVMVLAVPKRERSAEEISRFVESFHPLMKK